MPPSEPITQDKKGWRPSPGGAITAIVLVGLVVSGLLEREGPNSEEQQNERAAVTACWQSARASENPALDHGEKLAECGRLQSAYKKKFEGGQ